MHGPRLIILGRFGAWVAVLCILLSSSFQLRVGAEAAAPIYYVVGDEHRGIFLVTPEGIVENITRGIGIEGVKIDSSGSIVAVCPDVRADTRQPYILRIDPNTLQAKVIAKGGPFRFPMGLAIDSFGAYVVADAWAHAIFRVSPSGLIMNVTSGPPLQSPQDVVIDKAGYYIVTDSAASALFRVAPTGNVTKIATITIPGGLTGGVAIDKDGNYIVAYGRGLIKVTPTASITTIYTNENLKYPVGVHIDADGNYILVDRNYESTSGHGAVFRITPTGSISAIASGDPLAAPMFVTSIEKERHLVTYYEPDPRIEKRNEMLYFDGSTFSLNASAEVEKDSLSDYLFDRWDVNGVTQSTSVYLTLLIDGPKEVRAIYKVERKKFLITYFWPDPLSQIRQDELHEAGSTFSLTAPQRVEKDFFNDYVFDHWQVNGATYSTSLSLQLMVDSPKDVMAIYRTELNMAKAAILIVGLVTIGALLVVLIRRRPAEVLPIPPPPPP